MIAVPPSDSAHIRRTFGAKHQIPSLQNAGDGGLRQIAPKAPLKRGAFWRTDLAHPTAIAALEGEHSLFGALEAAQRGMAVERAGRPPSRIDQGRR